MGPPGLQLALLDPPIRLRAQPHAGDRRAAGAVLVPQRPLRAETGAADADVRAGRGARVPHQRVRVHARSGWAVPARGEDVRDDVYGIGAVFPGELGGGGVGESVFEGILERLGFWGEECWS